MPEIKKRRGRRPSLETLTDFVSPTSDATMPEKPAPKKGKMLTYRGPRNAIKVPECGVSCSQGSRVSVKGLTAAQVARLEECGFVSE